MWFSLRENLKIFRFARHLTAKPLQPIEKPVNPVTCPECSSSSFRLSRFRLKDVERLLLLQYPVRCRKCQRRVYAGLPLALVLLQASRVRRERRSHEATH
jgi:hypothetical protein